MNAAIISKKTRMDWTPILIGVAILFLYSSVILGLIRHWSADDNYSHGLLVPFVIALIIWQERGNLAKHLERPETVLGTVIILFGLLMLLAGTLGAELFSQRLSLVLVIAGAIVYLYGRRVLACLFAPLLLLLLSIPIPQIVLNKVAFPLQLLATRVAEWGIALFGIPSFRRGNVIELIPYGEAKYVGLEVVEACSGIRSLVTLVTLAVVLTYFSHTSGRNSGGGLWHFYRDRDLWRGAILVALSVPIALVTNAARVLITGLATYRYGAGVTESWWHEAFGWLTFLAGLVLLFVANVGLMRLFANSRPTDSVERSASTSTDRLIRASPAQVGVLFVLLLAGGTLINWFQLRTEAPIDRRPLDEFPIILGEAFRPAADKRFSPATEEVLKATDYVMRDYFARSRRFNLYIGYYASQRTGATYHSPQNCLPGSGWEMSNGSAVEILSPEGRVVKASRYVVTNGNRRSIMIYWYQGRGRTNSSEYWDKFHTIVDSISKGRSDGAMVRVMTPVSVGESDDEAFEVVKNFAGTVADSLSEYVPE